MYCEKCGENLNEGCKICPICGNIVNSSILLPNITNDSDQSYNSDEERKPGLLKRLITICEIILIVYFLFFGDMNLAITDLYAFLQGNDYDNPYLEMVMNHRPFEGGNTYVGAFSNAFDSNEWEYFKAEGKRIVQVTSRYNDLNDELITQILIKPTEESGEFYIEPYAMRLSGKDLSSLAMNTVLAGVFKGDIAYGFFNYILNSLI